MTQICRVCNIEKPIEEFVKNSRRKDGYDTRCLVCDRAYKHTKVLERADEVYAQRKTYREANAEVIKERKRQDYQANKEQRQVSHKRYYEENKEAVLEACKQYRDEHKEWKKAYDKQYAETHQECMKQIHKRYVDRHRDDPFYVVRVRLSQRLNKALKRSKKTKATMELVGCSKEVLITHLEAQFQEGMSWDNYGRNGWHIDHIKPCAAFDLTDVEQQKACFHYTNLQPLWAEDNMRKNSLWEGIRIRRTQQH